MFGFQPRAVAGIKRLLIDGAEAAILDIGVPKSTPSNKIKARTGKRSILYRLRCKATVRGQRSRNFQDLKVDYTI
jgi:hypothetical protein